MSGTLSNYSITAIANVLLLAQACAQVPLCIRITGVRSESGVMSLSVRCGAGRWLRRHIRLALRPAGVGATALCEATKGTSTESRCALVAIDTQGAGPLAIWHGASPAV
jgi:hypothetical protein